MYYGGEFERGHPRYAMSPDCVAWRQQHDTSCVAQYRGIGHNARDKRAVWDEKHLKTKSGLRRADLMENSRGRVVSKRAHAAGLRRVGNLRQRDAAGMAALRAMRCGKGQHKRNGRCVAIPVSPRRSRTRMGYRKKSAKKSARKSARKSPRASAAAYRRRSPYYRY